MKRIPLMLIALCLIACSSKGNTVDSAAMDSAQAAVETQADKAPQSKQANSKRELTPAIYEKKVLVKDGFDKKKAFIVISKKDLTLSVYAPVDGDTTLIARYPVCLSRNFGQKQKVGDMKTPESTPSGKPFSITQIQDASSWRHDFKDGRGNIKAYGNWFLRLKTPGHSGIGIHGSTNNEKSVPGRESEGCIRLFDEDIIHLKNNYAYVGMPVIIKTETEGNLPFEK